METSRLNIVLQGVNVEDGARICAPYFEVFHQKEETKRWRGSFEKSARETVKQRQHIKSVPVHFRAREMGIGPHFHQMWVARFFHCPAWESPWSTYGSAQGTFTHGWHVQFYSILNPQHSCASPKDRQHLLKLLPEDTWVVMGNDRNVFV